MLQRLMANARASATRAGHVPIRALILTPTRELAAQVEESVRTYGKYLPLTSMVMFGGVGMNPQIDELRRGVDILVATPGRLLDHHGQRTLDLSHVQILVLDEADRMLDMGFIHDIKKVLAVVPAKKQSLLFSATFSDEIKALADRLLNQPALIEVARRNATAERIAQRCTRSPRERKKELLAHLIQQARLAPGAGVHAHQARRQPPGRVPEQDGISAMAIHGNKSQTARTKALADFKSGDLRVLVATDIAARGIDIDQLPHVVNFELPNVPEDYVHRIGRTGRAGATRRGHLAGLRGRRDLPARHRALDQAQHPARGGRGLRARPGESAEPIVLGRMTIGVGGNRRGGNGGRPWRPPQGRGEAGAPSRAASPLQARMRRAAPRAARPEPARGPRPGGSGGGPHGGTGGARPSRGGRGR